VWAFPTAQLDHARHSVKYAPDVYVRRAGSRAEWTWGSAARLVAGGPRGIGKAVAAARLRDGSERASFICGANIDVDGGHQRSIM
jgi:hypothetical protein